MLIWNADPVAISLGPLAIRWYGLLFAAAFFCGLQIMAAMYDREGRPRSDLDSLLAHVVVGTLVGARLGHCLIYDPSYYLSDPLAILRIWEGGLASHGGAAGILIAVGLYVRKHGPGFLWVLDRIAVPAALGGAFIRCGNFMNSEIVGIPATVPWAVVFEQVDMLPRHPVQLYEALAYAGIFGILSWGYFRARAGRYEGVLAGGFLVLVFSARFALEFFKTPQAEYETGFVLSVGQWLSIPCVLAGAWLVARASRTARYGRSTPSGRS